MFVSCVQKRVVEGSGVGSGGCVVHVDVHGERVICRWLKCSCYTKHCRYGLSCLYAKTMECMSSTGSIW